MLHSLNFHMLVLYVSMVLALVAMLGVLLSCAWFRFAQKKSAAQFHKLFAAELFWTTCPLLITVFLLWVIFVVA